MLGLPLLLLSGSNPVSRYVVQIILVFAICISVLGFIFPPKMLRPLLANGSEHRSSSIGASYVSSTSGGGGVSKRSQESMGSNPDVGGAMAVRKNSQESVVSWKDKGDELASTALKE